MSMETKFFELEKKLFPRLPEISSKVDATAIYNLEPATNRLFYACCYIFTAKRSNYKIDTLIMQTNNAFPDYNC